MKLSRYVFLGVGAFIFIILILFFVGSCNISFFGAKENTPELEAAIEIDSTVSVAAWGEDTDGDNKADSIFLTVRPLFGTSSALDLGQSITSVEVKNVKLTNGPKVGKVKRVYPGDQRRDEQCGGFFYDGCDSDLKSVDINDQGDEYSYEIVDDPVTRSQVSEGFFAPDFMIVVSDLGNIYYDQIIKEDGSYNSANVIAYSGVEFSDLSFRFEFDVEIEIDGLGTYRKHFYRDIDGQEVADFASNLSMMKK